MRPHGTGEGCEQMGRGETLARIGREAFDVVVVGAGVNGAGIARDAAMRGLRVLLLDKGDLAGGTTSWSSRLIHGGLRYLEHREIGLVRESLRERERLLRIAPHLVEPLPLLIPIYRGDKRGPWLIRAGMVAYDLLSYDKSLDRHRMLSAEGARRRAPGLAPEGLQGAAVYFDAQVEYAERLAVENALAAREHGAAVLTYARVERLLTADGADGTGPSVRGVAFTDLLGGGEHEVRAAVTVNVAGPWVDQVLKGLSPGVDGPGPDVDGAGRMIGGTKGSHIVVDAFQGAPRDALYVEAKRDGRPFFIIPWNGLYLIGTTDTRYTGDLDRVEAEEAEIAYLVEETNQVIPAAGLTRASVQFTYAGVRPLPYRHDGREGAITRRHIVHDHAKAGRPRARGLLSIVGGKLTTYRHLAEQATDAVFAKLDRPAPPCRTAQVPLPGAGNKVGDWEAFRERFGAASGLPAASADHLLRVYGTRAERVLELAREAPELREPFSPETGAIGAEVLLAVREELAETLADVLLRRTMVGLGPEVGLGADAAAAGIAQRYLGWDVARAEREVAAYRAYVARFTPRAMVGV